MTDNPGTSRRRVGHVVVVALVRLICIIRYRGVKPNTQSLIYVMDCLYANAVMDVGTKVSQSDEKSSRKRSGRSSRPSNSQDKGLKNG